MHRPGSATLQPPARLAGRQVLGWALVLLLPLHAFAAALLPAWRPAHHHGAPAAMPLAVHASRPSPARMPVLAGAVDTLRTAASLRAPHAHGHVATLPAATTQAARAAHGHAHLHSRAHGHDAGHRHGPRPAPQPPARSTRRAVAGEGPPSIRVADPNTPEDLHAHALQAPHDHATIGRHHHGREGHAAATLVLAPASDDGIADGASPRTVWDIPWPLMPPATRIAACGTEAGLCAHRPPANPTPASGALLRPPRCAT